MPTTVRLALLLLAAAAAASAESPAPPPSTPADVRPLAVGTRAPGPLLQDAAGADFDLGAALAGKPTLLVFYRGGWCPYCRRHLAALAEAEPQLQELGYQVIAVSPDAPAALRPAAENNNLTYRLASDRGMRAARAYGLAYRVDAATRELYAGYRIDLAPLPDDPGSERWLPVPAAFLIDRHGVIRFVHANPDYKKRIDPAELIAAARTARD